MKINLIMPIVVVVVVDRIGAEKHEAWKAAGTAARQDREGTTTNVSCAKSSEERSYDIY